MVRALAASALKIIAKFRFASKNNLWRVIIICDAIYHFNFKGLKLSVRDHLDGFTISCTASVHNGDVYVSINVPEAILGI